MPLPSRASTRRRSAEACERVARHLDQQFHRPVTARELCDVAYLSEFQLQRCFTQTLGLTVGDHLRRRRVERAMQLLACRGDGLQAVARDVGLGSAAALVHLFKRETGLTPGAFREREQDDGATVAGWAPAPAAGAALDASDLAAWLCELAPQPVLCLAARGQSGRGFAHIGFAAADALLAEHRRLWPGQPAGPVHALYHERSLAPSDPSTHQLLAMPLGVGRPSAAPAPGFHFDRLAGGLHLMVAADGPHQFAWQRWSRALRAGLFERLGVRPRLSAPPFEVCDGFVGLGEARERAHLRLAFPVLPRQTGARQAAEQAERDAEALSAFRPRPGRLFERLHQLPL
jgi:AraC-like DNA-binding protein